MFEEDSANEISIECMLNAIDIAEWHLHEICRLRECGYISVELRNAETLRCWLLENRFWQNVNIRDIMRRGPKPATNAEITKHLMTLLEKNGWVVRLPENSFVDGGRSKLS